MKVVKVDLGERGYDIQIGAGLSLADALPKGGEYGALVVTDSNVDGLYGDRCQKQLEEQGLAVSRCVVPAGESSKDIDRVHDIYDKAFESGLDRTSLIVALGGGVVGDLAGFVAATYMRGVSYIQVPTTLLAMVDSSVGGKTGVNVPQGKNLVGAFYQPTTVVADLDTLDTLPEREYRCGLAEIIKYAIIRDADLFDKLEASVDAVSAKDRQVMTEIIARCCEIKAEVVSVDEKESGLRAILNFGHTLGHAIENAAGYGNLLHGEAISIGMVYAAKLSEEINDLPKEEMGRITGLLEAYGLPAGFGSIEKPGWPAVRKAIAVDKKARGSVPLFVLAEKIGAVQYGCRVTEDVLEEIYDDIC